MRARDQNMSCSVPSEDALFDRKLWYVPDRRIRTQVAARQATEIAEWARTGRTLEVVPDEHALFAAFHTCAFRAKRSMAMSPAQRGQWAGRWHTIREHIVKANMGLAHAMLRRLSHRTHDEDARVSEAMYGLVRAVERFDPWKGYCFSTYACNVIARGLMRCYRRERRHEERFPVQYDGTWERPSQRVDRAGALAAERLRHAIVKNLAGLTPIEAKILNQRFPQSSPTEKGATFYEIGNEIGLSRERVRQIQNVAILKLRSVLQADPVLSDG